MRINFDAAVLRNFVRAENGMVTVEWVALAGAIVIGAITVGWILMNGLSTPANSVGNALSNCMSTASASGSTSNCSSP